MPGPAARMRRVRHSVRWFEIRPRYTPFRIIGIACGRAWIGEPPDPSKDHRGREVIVISSERPPKRIIQMGMGQLRLPDTEVDRLAAWRQAWMARRRGGG